MNILIIEDIASSTFGGAERSTRYFSEYLSDQHRIHLVYDRVGDYVTEADKAAIYRTIMRVSTLPLRAQSPIAWIKSVLRLARLCKTEKIDLIVTHVVHASAMLRVLQAIYPVRVAMIFRWVCATERVGVQAEWGLKGLDTATAVSQYVADYWLKNGVPASKMHVIPNGVNFHEIVEREEDGDGGRDGETAGQQIFKIGFAGRIVEEKGIDNILDALAIITVPGVALECFIMGVFAPNSSHPDSAYHTSIQEKIEKLGLQGRVNFLGFVDPLAPTLREMDAVVVPSLCQEANSRVLLGAMAAGTPVIASRVGGTPEVLGDEFDNWLYEPGNVNELCAKLLTLMNLSHEEVRLLSHRLQQHIITNYTIDVTHRRLMSVLEMEE